MKHKTLISTILCILSLSLGACAEKPLRHRLAMTNSFTVLAVPKLREARTFAAQVTQFQPDLILTDFSTLEGHTPQQIFILSLAKSLRARAKRFHMTLAEGREGEAVNCLNLREFLSGESRVRILALFDAHSDSWLGACVSQIPGQRFVQASKWIEPGKNIEFQIPQEVLKQTSDHLLERAAALDIELRKLTLNGDLRQSLEAKRAQTQAWRRAFKSL